MLAFIQFAVILDFMVMAPLGAIFMPRMGISPAKFSHVVSAYAFAVGGAGLLAAGNAAHQIPVFPLKNHLPCAPRYPFYSCWV